MDGLIEWAAEEFGAAQLKDQRRPVRLVQMAASAAEHPSGLVTQVFADPAEREGAFRFLENPSIDDAAVAAPMFAATARRCAHVSELVVAVDQSTVSIVDRSACKGLGRVGTVTQHSSRRGFAVMSALAVLPSGQSAGLLAQQWHSRGDERTKVSHYDNRPVEQRESDLWRLCMEAMVKVLGETAPLCRPWVQMDRGADISHVLIAASRLAIDFTIRSSSNRCLEPLGYAHDQIRRSRVLGVATLRIPDSHAPSGMPRASALKFAVRARRLAIRFNNAHGKRISTLPLTVVHIREMSSRGAAPIEWFLLTNRCVATLDEALKVVSNYTCRWKIEEFHLAWKSGVCGVESSQLRSAPAFRRWATILAAVATRAERLKFASRTTPDHPATSELSRDEIDAAILLNRTTKFKRGDYLTLEQAVELIAFAGSYTGRKSSGGPPGAKVIARGLAKVAVAVKIIEAMRQSCG